VRKNRLINPGLAAAVAAAAAATASVLALASGGEAASPTICSRASTATANASCMTEQVVPHVLTAGKDAVSATHFTNQSGVGGATATHAVLSLTLRDATTNAALSFTVKSIKLLVNEIDVSSSCLPPSGSVLAVSCSVGNIIGGDDAEMIVRFSTTSPGNVVGAVTYGEGGSDSSPPRPNGSVNDTQVARDSLAIAGSSATGNCYDVATGGQTPEVRGSTTAQSITAVVGKASSVNLPCTPVSAGVDIDPDHLRRPLTFSQSVVFVEFTTITGGAAGTVTIDFLSSLPKGFVLKELKLGFVPTLAGSWAEVPTCASNQGGDSCIVSTKNLPKGGMEYILNVLGSSFDPRYGG
jgi:hypothetical protein